MEFNMGDIFKNFVGQDVKVVGFLANRIAVTFTNKRGESNMYSVNTTGRVESKKFSLHDLDLATRNYHINKQFQGILGKTVGLSYEESKWYSDEINKDLDTLNKKLYNLLKETK